MDYGKGNIRRDFIFLQRDPPIAWPVEISDDDIKVSDESGVTKHQGNAMSTAARLAVCLFWIQKLGCDELKNATLPNRN